MQTYLTTNSVIADVALGLSLKGKKAFRIFKLPSFHIAPPTAFEKLMFEKELIKEGEDPQAEEIEELLSGWERVCRSQHI